MRNFQHHNLSRIFFLFFPLTALTVTSTMVYAEKVLPVFSGWYVAGNYFGGDYPKPPLIDTCGNPHTQWIMQGNDKEDLLLQAYRYMDAKLNAPCKGRKMNLKYRFISNSIPIDFPSQSKADWDAVQTQDPEHAYTYTYEVDSNPGENIFCPYEIGLLPAYNCPEGSRASYDDEYKTVVCTTTPKACLADVVGRDLDVPGFGFLGHVGFTGDNNNSVVEVLNDIDVIHTHDYLDVFKNASKYWGERFGLDKQFDYYWASDILKTARDQTNFDPQYTYTAQWQAGAYTSSKVFDAKNKTFVKQKAFKRAIFRCDTFVNYCFNKVLGQLLPKSGVIMPVATYNSFMHERTPAAETSFLSNHFSVGFDSHIQDYLSNPVISRAKKLNFLWAQVPGADENRKSYILDTLGHLKAKELIPHMIEDYSIEKNGKNRSRLISALVASISDTEMLDQTSIQSIMTVQEFIRDLLLHENDIHALHQAILQSLSLYPMNAETYHLISDAIRRLEKLKPGYLAPEKKYLLLLSMAFSTTTLQLNIVPDFLVYPFNKEEETAFINALTFLLKQMDAKDIHTSLKKPLQSFIDSAKTVSKETYPIFLKSLKGPEQELNRKKFLNEILKSSNTWELVLEFNKLDVESLSHLTKDELNNLIARFEKERFDPSSEKRHSYLLALSKLYRQQ